MKNLFPLMLLTLIFTAACDSPRTQRALSYNSSNGLTNSGNVATVNLGNNNSSTIPVTTNGTSSVIPTDASQCKFASDGVTGFESTSTHLGDYTLCQSSTDKGVVYFQLKTPPTNTNGDISICLIPTTSSGANSIYVGNPMCGYFKDPKTIRKINFIKYAQYSNSTITGVMVFKDLTWPYSIYYKYNAGYGYYAVYNNYINTLDAYKLCMSMISDINNSSNCSYFKAVGQYVYKEF
ncbi:MAG: hypothetical protein Q7U04_14050 [Bacteriovorax sp.]|nr:hypothetical protein [Bacteriovorax sp.]